MGFMCFMDIFVTRVWESSPDENFFADQNFSPLIWKWQAYGFTGSSEFSTGVCQNFARSFRNDSHLSYRKEGRFRNCSFRKDSHLSFQRDSSFALNNICVWKSRFKKTITPQNFGAVISKRQSSIISKWIQHCDAHFEMTVIYHIETNFLRIVLPSFQNDSPLSRALEMAVSTNLYLAGC